MYLSGNFECFPFIVTMKYLHTLLLSILFFLSPVFGQIDHLPPSIYPSKITAYDIEQGLPASCVDGAFVDKKGRLWLNPCSNQEIHKTLNFYQFDGYRSYFLSILFPGEENVIAKAIISGINKSGELYGRVQSSGEAFLFDPDTHATQFFSIDKNEFLINVVADENDILYILSYDKDNYYIYKIDKRQLLKIGTIPGLTQENIFLETREFRFFIIKNQDIWFVDNIPNNGNRLLEILPDLGLIHFNIETASFERYPFSIIFEGIVDAKKDFSDCFKNITFDGSENILLNLIKQQQVVSFNILTKKSTNNHPVNSIIRRLNFAPANIVIHKDEQHNLLFEIWFDQSQINSAYLLLDKGGELFDYGPVIKAAAADSRYKAPDLFDVSSLDFKKEVYFSMAGGLVVADIKPVKSYQVFLKGEPLRGIAELAPDKLLIRSDNGLFLVNPKTHADVAISFDELCYGLSDPRTFVTFKNDQQGNIFLPVGDQLLKYNDASKTCITYSIGIIFEKFNFINEELIVLVSNKNQVYFYDLKTEKLQAFSENGKPLFIGNYANEIIVSKDGLIWIASLNGLWRIDRAAGKSQRFGIENGFKDDRLMCIQEDEKGRLWIGSYLGGLQLFDKKTETVEVIDKKKGLSNNTVVSILADDDENRWLATYNGLTIVSSTGEVLTHIFEEEGLSDKECNRYSSYKTSDGKLVFGTVSGGNIFDPKIIKEKLLEKKALNIYLTGLAYFDDNDNKEIVRSNNFESLNRIELPATKRYLKVNFALSNYNSPESSQFSYKISNQSDEVDWIDIGPISSLTLNNLHVGEYDILIRGIDYKGQMTEQPIILPIRVKEFFYKTWWFIGLCTLVFGFVTFLWFRRIKEENIRLEAEVVKRTEKINAQTEALKQLDEMKSRFFTNISHELRTPLTIIGGMVDKMKENPEKWLSKGHSMIKRNSDNLINLVSQILDLRKLESGKLTLNLIQSDIIHYLNYLVESFHSLAENKDIQLYFHPDPSEMLMDYDPEKILRIVSNLLSNAFKFTPEGGDVIIQTSVENLDGKNRFIIQVKDTGIGIPNEKLAHVFDRFYQVDDTATRKGEGTGIGLALTQELVKLMQGNIKVESWLNEGTVFTVEIPITNNAVLSSITDGQITQKTSDPNLAIFTIDAIETRTLSAGDNQLPSLLIVEDNPDVIQYLLACLDDQFQLEVAKDGEEGIQKAIEQVPDIILSDVMMPKKDGFELCQTLKTDVRTSHIPIVLLTAKADQDARLSGLERGADAYLTKPFNKEELFIQLKNLIEVRRKLQERYSSIEALPPSQDVVFKEEDQFIENLRKIIEENFEDENFGIAELCREAAMSRAQLHRKIKALTGHSTSIFTRSIRLQKAKELLQTTTLNISEIAYTVGFSNPNYFTMVFSEKYGQSPSDFRK